MNNIFEQASRKRLRFQTPRGALSVEQLWDLPLDKGEINLYVIAQDLLTQVADKPAKELSFFIKAVSTDETAELKFEIVKHIVTTKVAEAEANQTEAIKRTQRAELDALIAAKKAEAKQNLSLEELEAMRAKL
jgi:branched-subunit amino acid aminotransferase/4-amino-4-deoxychorismate lyase